MASIIHAVARNPSTGSLLPMKDMLRKLLRALGVAALLLMVWVAFFAILWLSRGAGGGYAAFAVAVAVAGVLWWRWSRHRSRLASALLGSAMVLALAPLGYLLNPLASSTLAPLPADPAVQMWPTGPGRAVAVYRYLPAAGVADRNLALVFVHGGPGGYVRDFDRAFFRTFTKDGFEVVLYDQSGAGRSPLGDVGDYSHERNIGDLLAVLTRVNKPTVLVGQSYGATLVTSALANAEVRGRVSHVVLSEPGKIPGATFSSGPGMTDKSTIAADAGQPPSASVVAKLAAPRAILAALLPAGHHYASQEEIINHYTPEVQRAMVGNSFCKGDTKVLEGFQPTRFNLLANAIVGRQSRDSATPNLQDLAAPVLLILGECSYIPRGRAMEYFDIYKIARSNLIPGVGHITWGNAQGQDLTRDAITRFVDNAPGPLANEPTQSTRRAFVESGR